MLDFFLRATSSTPLLPGLYDPWLVALSVAVAVVTSTLAMNLAGLARNATGALNRNLAVVTGGVALGAGVWAMHFIGMLAFRLCVSVHYEMDRTLLSMAPALGASWLALALLSQGEMTRWQLVVGGVLVGGGIGAMHYSGMAAMRMAPTLRYDPYWFAASIVVAVALAMLALWVRFPLHRRNYQRQWVATLAAGVVMGTAISGMHYTAMNAALFVGWAEQDTPVIGDWAHTLAITLAVVTISVASFIGVVNTLVRYRDLYRTIERSEARLRTLVDTAVDGIITIDPKGTVQSFNRSAERIFGWTADEVLGRNIRMLMPNPHSDAHDGYLAHHMQTGEARIIGRGREVQGLRKDGTLVPLRLGIGRAETSFGPPLFVGFMTDLTAVKESEAQLGIAASVFAHSYEAILILDEHHRVVDMNPSFARMTGCPRHECMGELVESLYGSGEPDPHSLDETGDFTDIWDAVEMEGYWQGELVGLRHAGAGVVQRVSIAAVIDGEARAHHYIVVISDISQLKAYEQELEQFALYDALTGLPNRRLLTDRLEHAIGYAQRHQTLLAVCYLDLDGFKKVNDVHGHAAGDILLAEIGHRISHLLRSEDTLARLGGDEMVMLLGNLTTPDDCNPVLQRVLEVVNQPVELPTGQGFVSTSIGISIYPLDGDTSEQVMRQADQAMYESKRTGKNRCTRFTLEMESTDAAVHLR